MTCSQKFQSVKLLQTCWKSRATQSHGTPNQDHFVKVKNHKQNILLHVFCFEMFLPLHPKKTGRTVLQSPGWAGYDYINSTGFLYIFFFSLMERVVVLAARQKCLVCLQGCCTKEGAQQELPAGHCVPRQWGRGFFTVIPISTHISRQWWAGTACLCRFSHIKWGCSLSEAIGVSNIAKTTHSSC